MRKIIVASNLKGDLSFIYEKIETLQSKGQIFSFLLLVGSTLDLSTINSEDYISGKLKIPIETYFIDCGPLNSVLKCNFPSGKEIVHNFHYLGVKGIKEIQNYLKNNMII